MTDAAGIILGLPGLFTSCVDCFNYIQLARNFGSDYEECLLALDTTKLRLSRWGVAIGIKDGRLMNAEVLDETELQMATDLLESILTTFNQAEKTSARLESARRKKDPPSTAVPVYNFATDPETDLGLEYQHLHRTVDGIVEKRHIVSTLVKKTKWALYEKGKFDSMVAEVRGFVSELVELFPPSAKAREHQLCKEEVEEVKGNNELVILQESIRDFDPELQESIGEALAARGIGHAVEDFRNGLYGKMNVGDENAPGRQSLGPTVKKFTNSGDLNVGNRNL